MPKTFLLLALLGCYSLLLSAQKGHYAPPIKGPLLVTGTFGELRSDHFHAGLDFRGAVGTPVYSVADGYISRVLISAGGYGQAIYVDHLDGYRSVYGHLSALRDDLIDTVRSLQYEWEQFTLDLRFDSLAFPVRQGDQIGKIGNRGYSFGPHLHFEIRDQASDTPLNPLDFGIKVADTRPPQLRQLKLYELDQNLNTIREIPLELSRLKSGDYTVQSAPIEVYSPIIGTGIKAYDRQNGMPNYNGIYSAHLYRDTTNLLHGFTYDSISYEETRYLNAHTDYAAWNANKSWFHRLYLLPGDALSFYENPTKIKQGDERTP
ncbi:MAG: M23 family metallopeptidase, partial [Bacteroidota bacterium]